MDKTNKTQLHAAYKRLTSALRIQTKSERIKKNIFHENGRQEKEG